MVIRCCWLVLAVKPRKTNFARSSAGQHNPSRDAKPSPLWFGSYPEHGPKVQISILCGVMSLFSEVGTGLGAPTKVGPPGDIRDRNRSICPGVTCGFAESR